MAHHHDKSSAWADRIKPAGDGPGFDASEGFEPSFPKQSFHNSHTSMGGSYGVAGHLLRMAGVFVPVLAGELVHDAAKYKKTVRLASIGTAMGFELLHLLKEQERAKRQEQKLAECRGRE